MWRKDEDTLCVTIKDQHNKGDKDSPPLWAKDRSVYLTTGRLTFFFFFLFHKNPIQIICVCRSAPGVSTDVVSITQGFMSSTTKRVKGERDRHEGGQRGGQRGREILPPAVFPTVTVENVILLLHEYRAVTDCMPNPSRPGYLRRRMPRDRDGFPRGKWDT